MFAVEKFKFVKSSTKEIWIALNKNTRLEIGGCLLVTGTCTSIAELERAVAHLKSDLDDALTKARKQPGDMRGGDFQNGRFELG